MQDGALCAAPAFLPSPSNTGLTHISFGPLVLLGPPRCAEGNTNVINTPRRGYCRQSRGNSWRLVLCFRAGSRKEIGCAGNLLIAFCRHFSCLLISFQLVHLASQFQASDYACAKFGAGGKPYLISSVPMSNSANARDRICCHLRPTIYKPARSLPAT